MLRNPFSLVAVVVLVALPQTASAQNDRVFPVDGNPILGPITTMSRNGVAIKSGGGTQQVPADQIEKIMFSGDPPELTRGREFAIDGQYSQALEELQRVNAENIRREVIKADAEFYRLLSQARLALVGKGNRLQAAANLVNFVRNNGDNWHYFEAARLLGDLAVATGKLDQADKYYGVLGSAASTQRKIESAYLAGLIDLKQGNASEAQTNFDKVIGARVNTSGEARLQSLAKAGRVAALGVQGQTEQAITESKELIDQLDTTDAELAARIYNARGRAYMESDQTEAAIREYLHTHMLFSGIPDAHVEALTALVQLWPKVAKADRATEMRQMLQQTYPGWGS